VKGDATVEQQALTYAIIGTRNQIDFIWNFFVTVNMAVFALLFIYDETVASMKWITRIFMACGVAAFDFINGNGLVNAYTLLDALHDQFRTNFENLPKLTTAYRISFINAQYGDMSKLVMLTHGAALITVVLTLFWPSFLQHKKRNAKAASEPA
jgi:hypothetical protein